MRGKERESGQGGCENGLAGNWAVCSHTHCAYVGKTPVGN